MTSTESGKYGASRITTLLGALRRVVAEIMRDNPGVRDEVKLGELLMERIVGRDAAAMANMPDEHLAAMVYCATNHARAVARYEPDLSPEEYKVQRESRSRAQSETAKKIKKLAKVLYLEQIMPNDKRAGSCTLNYLGKHGAGWVKFSKMGKPSQLGDELGEGKAQQAFK